MRWYTIIILLLLGAVLATSGIAPARVQAQGETWFLGETQTITAWRPQSASQSTWTANETFVIPDGSTMYGGYWTFSSNFTVSGISGISADARNWWGGTQGVSERPSPMMWAVTGVTGRPSLTIAQAQAILANLGVPNWENGRYGNYGYLSAGVSTPSGLANPCAVSGGCTLTIQFTPILYGTPPATVASFTADPTSGDAPLLVSFTDTSTNASAWLWDFDGDGIEDSTDQHPQFTYTVPGTYTATLTVTGPGGSDVATETITVIDPVPPPILTLRPLAQVDERALFNLREYVEAYNPTTFWLANLFGYSENLSIEYGISNYAHANVYAPASGGTVTAVDRLRCNDDECNILIPELDAGTILVPRRLDTSAGDVFLVIIDTDNGQYQYIVSDPMVNVGDTLTGVCIIGKTIRTQPVYQDAALMLEIINGIMSTFFNRPNYGDDAVIVFRVADGNMQPITWGAYPIAGKACNVRPEFSECLGSNPAFERDGDGWTFSADVVFSPEGAFIPPGSEIYTHFFLDSSTEYTINTYILQNMGDTQLRVTLGQYTEFLTTPARTARAHSVGPYFPGGDIGGGVYEVGIKNTGSVGINVAYLCLTDNAAPIAPGSCYFDNPFFDTGGAGWTMNGGTSGPGYVAIQPGESISQTASLDPGIYSLKTAVLGYANMSAAPNVSGTARFYFTFPDTGESVEIGSVTFNNNFTGSETFELVTTFELDEPVASPFVFSVGIDEGASELNGLILDRICMNGKFSGGGGYVPTPLLPETCSVVIEPSSLPSAGLGYIRDYMKYFWLLLNRFLECDLMRVLNAIYAALIETFRLMGWQGRYWQASLFLYSNYATTDVIHWLNGHFRNMAVGQVTTINEAGGASIWDVLLALVNGLGDIIMKILDFLDWLIRQVVDLIGAVVYGLIALVLMIVSQVLNIALLARGILEAILFALNTATPTPIPGMPLCATDPRSSGWCISIWVLDNTLWSGPGAVVIPIIVGILSVHLLLWVVGEMKRSIIDVGKTA